MKIKMTEKMFNIVAEQTKVDNNEQCQLEIRVHKILAQLGRLRFGNSLWVETAQSRFKQHVGYTQIYNMCFELVKDWDIEYPGGPAHFIMFSTCDGSGRLLQDYACGEDPNIYAEWFNWNDGPVEICKAWCEMMEKKYEK